MMRYLVIMMAFTACYTPDFSADGGLNACGTGCPAKTHCSSKGFCLPDDSSAVDAGVVADGGNASVDIGNTSMDMGSMPIDTGSTPVDAGPASDTGTVFDAGPLPLGQSAELAASDCSEIKGLVPELTSGIYWIDPDGPNGRSPYRARCDMETLGGGWTIVKRWGSGQYYANILFMKRTNAMGRSQTAQGSVTDDTYAVPYEGGINSSNQVLLGWSFTGNQLVERATGYVHWSATLSEFNPVSDTAQSCAETGFWTRTQGGCEYSNGDNGVLAKSSNFTLSSWLIGDLEGTGIDWCSSRAWDDDAGLSQPNPEGEPSGNVQCSAYDDGHIWIAVRAVSDAHDGSSEGNAALTCSTLHDAHPNLPNGIYWVDPDGNDGLDAFQVLCYMDDQGDQGGGWTVVKSWGSGNMYSNELFMSRVNSMGQSSTVQGSPTGLTYAVPYQGLKTLSTQVMIFWVFTTANWVTHDAGHVIWNATLDQFNGALDTEASCESAGFWRHLSESCQLETGVGNDQIVSKSPEDATVGIYAFGSLMAARVDDCKFRDNTVWQPTGDNTISCSEYDNGRIFIMVK